MAKKNQVQGIGQTHMNTLAILVLIHMVIYILCMHVHCQIFKA